MIAHRRRNRRAGKNKGNILALASIIITWSMSKAEARPHDKISLNKSSIIFGLLSITFPLNIYQQIQFMEPVPAYRQRLYLDFGKKQMSALKLLR